jgi:hypothetical protein
MFSLLPVFQVPAKKSRTPPKSGAQVLTLFREPSQL